MENIKKELEEYKKLYAKAVLLRDKEFATMMKERSELLILAEQLKEAIDYHQRKSKEYEDKLKKLSAKTKNE